MDRGLWSGGKCLYLEMYCCLELSDTMLSQHSETSFVPINNVQTAGFRYPISLFGRFHYLLLQQYSAMTEAFHTQRAISYKAFRSVDPEF